MTPWPRFCIVLPMPSDPSLVFWWSVVALDVLLIGVTKSGFGAGVGLMVVPMIALAMKHIPGRGSEATLGLMLPLLVAGDLIAVWQYRHLFSMKIVRHLLPGTLVGVVLGGLLLLWFDKQGAGVIGALIRIEIGIESILLVGLHWWRMYRGVPHNLMPEPARSHLTGGFAGVSSTLAHAAGPIVATYLLPLQLDRQRFVGTCAIYFFLLNTAKLPVYWWAGQFARAELPFTSRFAPLLIVGALLGLWVNRKINDKVFSRIVYAVTFVLGWYVLIDGTLELAWSR